MGWLRLEGSLKLHVSFADYRLFYRPLLQKSFAKETYYFKEPTSRSHPITGVLLNQPYTMTLSLPLSIYLMYTHIYIQLYNASP